MATRKKIEVVPAEKVAQERAFIDAQKVHKRISKKLYAFNAAKNLAWAFNSGENIIMFGPGGYGKSEAAVEFFDLLKEEKLVNDDKPFIMALGTGLTQEQLLGGLDIKKFQDDGQLVYNLQHAFVSHEIVILEEIWDAYASVLLILKDILQSGHVRQGSQLMKIKTKMVIACTNKSREEVVIDNSTEALMQRFSYQVEVNWKSWEVEDYAKALSAGTGDAIDSVMLRQVASMCAAVSKKDKGEYLVSPRTAFKVYNSCKINGIEAINGFHGFNNIKANDDHKIALQKLEIERLSNMVSDYVLQAKNIKSALKLIKLSKKIDLINTDLAVLDANIDLARTLRQHKEFYGQYIWRQAQDFIIKPKQGSFIERVSKTKAEDRTYLFDLIHIDEKS